MHSRANNVNRRRDTEFQGRETRRKQDAAHLHNPIKRLIGIHSASGRRRQFHSMAFQLTSPLPLPPPHFPFGSQSQWVSGNRLPEMEMTSYFWQHWRCDWMMAVSGWPECSGTLRSNHSNASRASGASGASGTSGSHRQLAVIIIGIDDKRVGI